MIDLTYESRKNWFRGCSKYLASFLGLVVFAAAAWAIRNVLKAQSFAQIASQFASQSPQRIFAAFSLMIVSYLLLTVYDLLGLSYIRRVIPLGRAMLTSFLGYAFANNLGFLGGAGLRLRRYVSLGLTPVEVAKLIAFSAFTFWIGFAFLGGILFAVNPPPSPSAWMTSTEIRVFGFLLLISVALYLGQSHAKWRDFRVGGRDFVLPSIKIRLGQILVSIIDWVLAASVLYVILPGTWHIGFAIFLPAFLCAQMLGLASNVPGGLGVFETVLLYALPIPFGQEGGLFASLLQFRLIYFFSPLIVATGIAGLIELRHHFLATCRRIRTKRVTPKASRDEDQNARDKDGHE